MRPLGEAEAVAAGDKGAIVFLAGGVKRFGAPYD